MKIDDKTEDGKLQYDNRETAKTSLLLPGKIDKYILQVKKYCLLIKDT